MTRFSEVGKDLAEVLVDSGFARSKTEARKLIKNRSIRWNDEIVEDPFARVIMWEGQMSLLEDLQKND